MGAAERAGRRQPGPTWAAACPMRVRRQVGRVQGLAQAPAEPVLHWRPTLRNPGVRLSRRLDARAERLCGGGPFGGRRRLGYRFRATAQLAPGGEGGRPQLPWNLQRTGFLDDMDPANAFGGASGRIKANSEAAFRQLVSRFLGFYADNLFNSHWGEQVSVRPDNSLNLSMACQGLDTAEATAAWRPFLDWVKASPADFAI